MKYSVVYSKEGGNTRLLADGVKKTLLDVSYFGDINDEAIASDIIFVGFWTDKGTCDDKAAEFLRKLSNKKVFLFGSCGFGKDPSYFEKIIDRTKSNLNDTNEVLGSFMCQGKMHQSVRDRYVKLKETNPNMPNIDLLIENFDEALTHPDDKDFSNLANEINKVVKE